MPDPAETFAMWQKIDRHNALLRKKSKNKNNKRQRTWKIVSTLLCFQWVK